MEFLNEILLGLFGALGLTIGGVFAWAFQFARKAVTSQRRIVSLVDAVPGLEKYLFDTVLALIKQGEETVDFNYDSNYRRLLMGRAMEFMRRLEKLTGVKLSTLVDEEYLDTLISHAISEARREFKHKLM